METEKEMDASQNHIRLGNRAADEEMTMSGLVNSKDDRCRLLGKEGNATTKIEMGFSDLGV